MTELTEQEKLIFEAIVAGRTVQNYIWGEHSLAKTPYEVNKDIWVEVFYKRVFKIHQIDFTHPSAMIELRKRVLQQAALSIQALEVIDQYLDFPELKDEKLSKNTH